MLKIKDDIDLKELEKFGFKPKYSEKNGELVEYFFVNNKETSISKFLGISIIKKDTSLRNKKIRIRKEVYNKLNEETKRLLKLNNVKITFSNDIKEFQSVF